MKKFSERAQAKAGTIVLAVIAVGLIAAITSILIGNSNTNKIDNSSAGENIVSVDAQKPAINQPTQKVDIQPTATVPQAVEQTGTSLEAEKAPESKQTEAPVKSIQEGQPQVEAKPTQPPKPIPQGEVTDKSVKPTYREQDVKPQESQPKMGDKNDKGQIYIDGFGWVKDEGGGGKGTTVGKPGDQLTGNKVGTMN